MSSGDRSPVSDATARKSIVRSAPVVQSRSTIRKRSASKPGRLIARYARTFPSGEKRGCVSVAGLVVSFRGSAEPSMGAV